MALPSVPPPYVYIAAPFTAVAEKMSEEQKADPSKGSPWLFQIPRHHGVIPPGPYRNLLGDIAKVFKGLGFQALLPHRDVNRWGAKELSPSDIAHACVELVKGCDLFFGILGISHGAHLEAGIAIGLGKPSIVVSVGTEEESFVGQALMQSRYVVGIRVASFGGLRHFVQSDRFRRDIRRAIEIGRRT
jgi:hypothetical protein